MAGVRAERPAVAGSSWTTLAGRVSLVPAPSLASYAAAPSGRFWAGGSFAAWCATPGLFGFSLWGRPTAGELERLVGALRVELGPHAALHLSLVDASLVDQVEPAAFEVLQRYVVEHRDALGQRVKKLALVRPGGLPGAVVAGFFSVLAAPYPTHTVTDVPAGLAWLGAEARWAGALEALRAEASGIPPLLAQLRAALASSARDVSVSAVARQLGLSQRTLQRRLGELGTSYQKEALAHRLRTARAALSTGDAPITAIALEAGFSTPQHFSVAFRKDCGLTPSEWRARHTRR